MSIIHLSSSAETTIQQANEHTFANKCLDLDSTHLFRAILMHTEVGRAWLAMQKLNEVFLQKLEVGVQK